MKIDEAAVFYSYNIYCHFGYYLIISIFYMIDNRMKLLLENKCYILAHMCITNQHTNKSKSIKNFTRLMRLICHFLYICLKHLNL